MPSTHDDAPANEAFSLRLRIAALLRFRTVTAFLNAAQAKTKLSRNGFFKHWGGISQPRANIVEAYSQMLGVPQDWLSEGAGEKIEKLRRAFSAVERGDLDNPVVAGIMPGGSIAPVSSWLVNQQLEQFGTDSGKPPQIRHIPILVGDQIDRFLGGGSDASSMLTETETIALPPGVLAGARAFAFHIPDDDTSMLGQGEHSLPPKTLCWIDRDKQIGPGDFCLVRPVDGEWTIRRYKASFPYGRASSYTLEALNPSFEPVRVTDDLQWRIAGRVIFYGRVL